MFLSQSNEQNLKIEDSSKEIVEEEQKVKKDKRKFLKEKAK